MIELRTLGALDLRADGRELRSILAQPRRLALLAYLAIRSSPGFRQRDELLALFWPEYADERARAALNRAVYYLRHALGPGILLSRGDVEVGLATEHFRCDAAEFEAAAGSAQHTAALELYRGDLLSGFHVSAAPGFERWLESERDRMRLLAQRSAWAVAHTKRQEGDHVAAAKWARRVLELSPWDEAAVQQVIRLFDGMGDRASAVHVYEQFALRMAAELELSPSPETGALIEAIRSRAQPVSPGVTAAAEPTVQDPPDGAPHQHLGAAVARADSADSLAPVPPRTRRRYLIVTAMAFISIVVPTGIMKAVADRPALDPLLVRVMRIENRTADPLLDDVSRTATEWIARSIADAVESTTSPTARPGVRVVRMDERAFGGMSVTGDEVRAGVVVTGDIYRDGEQLRFHVRAIDEAQGGATWTIPALFARRDSMDTVLRELSQRATGAVTVLLDPDLASWFPLATVPPTQPALVEFLRGQSARRPREAARHYERAAELDTVLVWALLSAAQARMGFDPAKSRAILARLENDRDRLTPLAIYVLESCVARIEEDRVSLHRATTGAARLAPSRFLLAQASSAHALHRPHETLRVLDRAESQNRRGAGLAPHWPFRAMAYHETGQYHEELALARRVRREAGQDLSGVYAEVSALAGLRRTHHLLALLDTALSLPRDPYYSPGGTMLLAAQELRAHGNPDVSSDVLQRAIHWFRNNPPAQIDPVRHSADLATALYLAGVWDEADALLRQVVEGWPDTQRARIDGQLGAIAVRSGDLAAARQILASLDTIEIPTYGPASEVSLARARITALLGDAEGAVRILRQGVGGQGMDLHSDVDFEALRRHPAFREFTRPKG